MPATEPLQDGVPGASGAMADLTLLRDAAHAAAPIALHHWRGDPEVTEKPGGQGPVSEGDLAVNASLEDALRAARPAYAWLSEESPDEGDRRTGRAFVVDPIDGTRAFLDGHDGWAIAACVIENGAPIAACVHLPALGLTYAAARGAGATLNGAPIAPSGATDPKGATLLGKKASLRPEHWPQGPPPVTLKFRSSLAWRLCLVAEGRYDAMLTLNPSWYWDIAAGALIAAEAGARVTDARGHPLRFDAETPQTPGCIAAPPALHPHLIPRRGA